MTTFFPGVEDWPGGDGVHEARRQDVPGGRRRHWQERSPHLGEKDQRLARHAANLDFSFLSFWKFFINVSISQVIPKFKHQFEIHFTASLTIYGIILMDLKRRQALTLK